MKQQRMRKKAMQSKTKERIRDILYSNLATKEGKRKLATFSGRSTSHISELVKNYKIGSANVIGIIIAEIGRAHV